jgi:hypothetical protein
MCCSGRSFRQCCSWEARVEGHVEGTMGWENSHLRSKASALARHREAG